MSNADLRHVTGDRPGDRASSVPVPLGPLDTPLAPVDQSRQIARSFLRRQPVHIVAGRIEGGYTSAFEVICCDCGDNPNLGYSEVAPRLQRLRGPYPLHEGVAAYEAHLARTTHGVGDRPA